ncbi:MAG: hypothetical protein ACLGI6_07295, partial [Gammaproteobacteria bacterium]
MKLNDAMAELGRLARAGLELTRLPRAMLEFDRSIAPDQIAALYANFTRPHPRLRVVQNKTMGMALIDLASFNC